MKTKKLVIAFFLLILGGFFIWGYVADKLPNKKTEIMLAVPQTAYAIPTIIAVEKGFFKKENINVKVNYVHSGKVAMEQLLSGKANFANIVETNIAFSGFTNPDIKVLCNILRTDDAAIIARKDKGVNSVHDLKGKKIGIVPSSTSHIFLDRFLRKNNIQNNEVTIVEMGPLELQSAMIKDNKLDAVSLWEPYLCNIHKKLGDTAVVFKDKFIFTGYASLVGNSKYIEDNKDVAAKMIKALIEAEAFMQSNQKESKEIIASVLKIDKLALDHFWKDYEFHVSLSDELLDAVISEAYWIIVNLKDYSGKPLPEYSTYFAPSYLKEIDEDRVTW